MGTAVLDFERSAAPLWGTDKILNCLEPIGSRQAGELCCLIEERISHGGTKTRR